MFLAVIRGRNFCKMSIWFSIDCFELNLLSLDKMETEYSMFNLPL